MSPPAPAARAQPKRPRPLGSEPDHRPTELTERAARPLLQQTQEGDLATVVEIEVPGRMEVVDDLEAAVVALGARGGLDPDASHFLGVALREALTNAIRHGNGLASGRPVEVRIALDEGCLSLIVRDFGPGFEAEALPDPVAPEKRCLGCGRGIFFMRRFADEVVFHRPEGGGLAVELRKRLPAPRPDSWRPTS